MNDESSDDALGVRQAVEELIQLERQSAGVARRAARNVQPHARATERGVTMRSRGVDCEVERTL